MKVKLLKKFRRDYKYYFKDKKMYIINIHNGNEHVFLKSEKIELNWFLFVCDTYGEHKYIEYEYKLKQREVKRKLKQYEK